MPPRPRRAPGRSGPSNAAGPTTATAGAQVTVCAALCALAAATGVVRVLGELTEQLNTARAAVGYGGAAICIGAFFGLVVPRRIIRRRLGGEADSHGGAGPGVRFEFAATLAGVLILCLALVWTGLLGLASGLESYRILLTHRFVHPPGVTRLLLVAPVGLGLALLGAAGSTLLVALHGWLRLLQKDPAGVTRLWMAMLAAMALGAGLAAWLPQRSVLNLTTLLATFGAALVAVGRRSPGRAAVDVQHTPHIGPSALAAPLGSVALVSLSTGAGATADAVDSFVSAGTLGWGLLLLVGAALLGLLGTRVARRVALGADLAVPLLLLASGVAWSLPYRPGAGAGRLALLGLLAAACVVLVGRRIANVAGRIQPAVAWLGAAVTAGLGVGFALTSLWLRAHAVSGVAGASALVMAVAAGLSLCISRTVSRPLRRWGMAVIALWFIGLLTGMRIWFPQDASTLSTSDPGPATQVGRRLLGGADARATMVYAERGGTDRSRPIAGDVDLGGPRWDVVVVAAEPGGFALGSERAGQLLRRCHRALRPGGRLFIELPAEDLVTAVFRRRPRSTAHVLRVCGAATEYAALLIGDDARLWLEQRPVPTGFVTRLEPVRGADEIPALLNDAQP